MEHLSSYFFTGAVFGTVQRLSRFVFLGFCCFWFLSPNPCFAEEPIKIGIILPLTGDMAAVGSACRDAALMAMRDSASETRNKYVLKVEDDKMIPNEVAVAAQKLIAVDKVSAIISTWSYGGTIVSPLAERSKIPHIGIAWDRRIADGDFNFLHLTPPSEFMTKFLEAFRKIGVRRVALLGIQESGSVFALDEFERLAPNYGIEVVYRDAVIWDIKDFKSIVSRISKKNPEYLLFNLGGETLPKRILTDLRNLHAAFRFTAITSFDIMDDLTPVDGHWYVSDSYLPDDFTARFQESYGYNIRYGIGNFYEATRLLIRAFESSKNGTPAEAKDELLKVKNIPSVFGETSVDEAGIFTYPAQYMKLEGGKRVPIKLDNITQ